MPWPFSSSSSGGSPTSSKTEDAARSKSTSWNDLLPKPDPPLQAAKEWAPVFLTSVASLAAFIFYQSRLRRFPTAGHIQPDLFRKRTLLGRVTSVGDGDNFHMFHTPGGRLAGWDWLRKVPTTKAALKGKTVSSTNPTLEPDTDDQQRYLCGWLGSTPLRAHILVDRVSQEPRKLYNGLGVISSTNAFGPAFTDVISMNASLRQYVGLEMLKLGLATTYEAKSGAEWGGAEELYKAAEAKAKAKKLGIWNGKPSDFESPRAYKTRTNETEGKKSNWLSGWP
ncbi:putative endoplasmic reticulum membrane protein [Colletotrichum spaethianum]|uniref:Probable endonuclease LCL3 n=1 Tax=Colletotrichum spaethianum TaxID=700344 RepID=A0AA37P9D0_9PEZI|nr:putative endoplasmic reticulum membrane protein [Colletotrichum spaethianum]GKT48073.1 putative endoplasmic reticulum membrane protein [Colletotrichum spaethianum]